MMKFDPSSNLEGKKAFQSEKCTRPKCDCSNDKCPKFKSKTGCPPNCHATCKNQMFANQHLLPKVKARNSAISGTGLYTTVDIKKYALIIFYIGEVISDALRDERRKKYKERELVNCFFQIDGKLTIDPTEYGNAAKYANHSCDPNMIAISWKYHGAPEGFKAIVFKAEKNIKAGDELTFNYGPDYDKNLRCHCESDLCSGFIGKPLPSKELEAALEKRDQENVRNREALKDENTNRQLSRPRKAHMVAPVDDSEDEDEESDAWITPSAAPRSQRQHHHRSDVLDMVSDDVENTDPQEKRRRRARASMKERQRRRPALEVDSVEDEKEDEAAKTPKNVVQYEGMAHDPEIRKLQCPECWKVFSGKDKLRRHMKSHEDQAVTPCYLCGVQFKYSYMQTHMKKCFQDTSSNRERVQTIIRDNYSDFLEQLDAYSTDPFEKEPSLPPGYTKDSRGMIHGYNPNLKVDFIPRYSKMKLEHENGTESDEED